VQQGESARPRLQKNRSDGRDFSWPIVFVLETVRPSYYACPLTYTALIQQELLDGLSTEVHAGKPADSDETQRSGFLSKLIKMTQN
jgi:hypothetical protein